VYPMTDKLFFIFCFFPFLFSSCDNTRADVIVHGAKIYTVNSGNSIEQAMAINDGVIVGIGSDEEIFEKFSGQAVQKLNVQGLPIYPGFIDSHAHFLALGLLQNEIDLSGTTSYQEILQILEVYRDANPKVRYIKGRGWDENDWEEIKLPSKESLDSIFDDIPIILRRIDGHSILVNQVVLDRSGITSETAVEGGIIIKDDSGEPTGVLVDGAMRLVDGILPPPSKEEKIEALKKAEEICFSYGLTTVSDAGLDKEDILLIDELHKSGDLKIKVYAMVSNTPENLNYFLDERGPILTDRLSVRSIKVYADGALGSKGAALKENYSDADHKGLFVTNLDSLRKLAFRIAQNGAFQMNTHAIGDLAHQEVLKAYRNALFFSKDPRWRIEHAQIIDTTDLELYDYRIIPSVQPTHATSDMYWAEDRLGPDRMVGAYPFRRLLERSKSIALGTDFPVEEVSPFNTFMAAVARQDINGYPPEGFQIQDSLSREQALRGMTYWGAYANFEEDQKGSIEVGKAADFTILDNDIMNSNWVKVINSRVVATFINGDLVFTNRFE